MLGELVLFKTKDNLLLDGFYIHKRSKKGIIFIHGLTGRIHPGVLTDSLMNSLPKAGHQFLLFNNRGFGMVNSLKSSKKKGKSKTIGGSLERFEDCRLDIQAAVNFLKKKGCKKIILMGHSTGTQKSVYYLNQKPDRAVKGVILLAPAHDTEGEIAEKGKKKFQIQFNKAKRMVKAGKGKKLLGHLSAKRFYGLHKSNSKEGNIFNYLGGKLPAISKIKVPILAVFGSKEEYVMKGKQQDRLDLIKKYAKVPCEVALIRNADHGFKKNTKELIKVVRNWLKEN